MPFTILVYWGVTRPKNQTTKKSHKYIGVQNCKQRETVIFEQRHKSMVTILKLGAGKRAIQSVLKKLRERSPKKGLDAYKYCGTVKFKEA